MAIPEKKDVLYVCKLLLPHLDPEVRVRGEAMLLEVEEGKARPLELLELLSAAGEYPRAWLRMALLGEVDRRVLGIDAWPAGDPNSIPVGSVWVCKFGDFEFITFKAGETVPPCPTHRNYPLERKS